MIVGLWVLAGIVAFLIVEKFVRFVKGGHTHSHSHVVPAKQNESDKNSKDEQDKETESEKTEQEKNSETKGMLRTSVPSYAFYLCQCLRTIILVIYHVCRVEF